MKAFLEGLLPRILPGDQDFLLVAHEGKSDLEKSLPRKLRGWRSPNTQFIVVRDQDSGDCVAVKEKLQRIAISAGRPETTVRIACRELESWILGDLPTVSEVFSRSNVKGLELTAKFRQPDSLGSPSAELKLLVPGYQKVSGARQMGPYINVHRCQSQSFAAFVAAVARLSE